LAEEAPEVPLVFEAEPEAASSDARERRRTEPSPTHELGPPVRQLEWVVFDTETTGFGPDAHMVELAAVRLSPDFVVQGIFSSLVRPPLPIPSDASAVHGIHDVHVEEAPRAPEVLQAFMDFARGAVLVAHNASFDRAILVAETDRARHEPRGAQRPLAPDAAGAAALPERAIVDTLKLARWAFPGLPSYTLGNLRDVLDLDGWDFSVANGEPGLVRAVSSRDAHRALPDALAAAKLLVRVLELVPGLAAGTLDELLEPPVDRTRNGAADANGALPRTSLPRPQAPPKPSEPGQLTLFPLV